MDGSHSKRAAREISTMKKKPATAVKDNAGSRDGMGQLCSRIGCCGRLNHSTKGTKYKSLEKPKPLKPSFCSSSSKEIKGSSSKSFSKSIENSEKKVRFKTESSSVTNEPKIQELSASGSRTSKLKPRSTANSESSNGRRKRLTQGESSSSGKGKKIIGASNEERVSDPKSSRNVASSRMNGVSSVRSRKSLNLETSKGSMSQQSSSVVTNTPQTREISLNGDRSTSDTSTNPAGVGFGNDNGRGHYNIDGIADVTSLGYLCMGHKG